MTFDAAAPGRLRPPQPLRDRLVRHLYEVMGHPLRRTAAPAGRVAGRLGRPGARPAPPRRLLQPCALTVPATRRSSHLGVARAAQGRGEVGDAGDADHLAAHQGLVAFLGDRVGVADQEARQLAELVIGRGGGLQHARGGDAGAQRGDRHARPLQFLRQRFGERQHVGLRSRHRSPAWAPAGTPRSTRR